MTKPVVYLTRREYFSAAHRLWSEVLSAAENHAIYGDCAREHGHGHNYTLEVTLRGGVDPATGIIVNLTEIRDAMADLIIDHVDHRHLNHSAEICQGINPTAENLVVLFWQLLQARFGDLLFEVMLRETDKNSVRYRGEFVDE